MPPEREVLEMDVLFVGAGPAGLAGAIRLADLWKAHNEEVAAGRKPGPPLPDPTIGVIEKGMAVGDHSFSGAVMDPGAIGRLLPNWKELGAPVEKTVEEEAVYALTERGATRLPLIPPAMHNLGFPIVTLSKFTRWMAAQAEERGVMVLPGFAGADLILEPDARGANHVMGVRIGDKGVNPDGTPKPNFEPGPEIRAKVSVLAEGSRGSLTRKAIERFHLQDGKAPQGFELGVKEVFEMPKGSTDRGRVVHTFGWPLDPVTAGGTFVYNLGDDKLCVGLVASLDSPDPKLDAHRELQRFKSHPFMEKLLEGGKVVAYGGKTLTASGYYSIPRLAMDGALLAGESAGLLNAARLKGIHLAIDSGILAAETAFRAILAADPSLRLLDAYDRAVREGPIFAELRTARNFHQAVSKKGLLRYIHLGIQTLTGGWDIPDPMPLHDDAKSTRPMAEIWGALDAQPPAPKYDGARFLDKNQDVFLAGSNHEEKQPVHLKQQSADVCARCYTIYRSPCVDFCPANVYSVNLDPATAVAKLAIGFGNCIHCKTCDIKCPENNILWTVPEGGGGPKYTLV